MLMHAMMSVNLTDSYKAVVDHQVDHLFKMTGTKEESLWFSSRRYSFDLYMGEGLADDPILGPVLKAAKAEGYATKRKADDELRQEIVILLTESISVSGRNANAWYIKKSQASAKWIPLGSFCTDRSHQDSAKEIKTAADDVEMTSGV